MASTALSIGDIAAPGSNNSATILSPDFARPHNAPQGNRRFTLLERDLHSIYQTAADILFIVALGLITGALFDSNLTSLFYRGPGRFWCALTIALLYMIMERARIRDNGIALTTRRSRFLSVTKVWTWSFVGLVFIGFALRTSADLSRMYLAMFYTSGLALFTLWRALVPPMIARASKRYGSARSDWVVVCDDSFSGLRDITTELSGYGSSIPTVIPLDVHCSEEQWPLEQQAVLSRACRALRAAPLGAIYLCSAGLTPSRLESLCGSLSILPVGSYIIPDNATAGLVGYKTLMMGNHLVLELRRPPMSSLQQTAKRVVDIALGVLATAMLSPILIGAAIAIWLDSRGPIFFRQSRTGKGGKVFRIYKFRSMYVMEDGPTIQQACRNDPRVTRVGRFLRASSIDELPQLVNVLRGEMSLVGPRPHAVAHDLHFAQLVDNYEVRQHVKPGITGWAQVNGLRGETANVDSMRRRIEADIWYAQNVSILLDFEIIVRTFIEVFRTRNAY